MQQYPSGHIRLLQNPHELEVFSNNRSKKIKLINQNKGQKEMVNEFLNSLLNNTNPPIPFHEIVSVTKASFKVLESIKNGGKQIQL